MQIGLTLAPSSPCSRAWEFILEGSCTPSEVHHIQTLFPDRTNTLDERGFSVLHKVVLQLQSGDVAQHIQTHRSQIDDTDSDGYNALMWAARRDDSESLKVLVQAGADVNISDNRGLSALHYAAKASGEEIFRTLLNAGADPRRVDNFGFSVLHYVAQSKPIIGAVKVSDLIKAGADPNERSKSGGGTPLQRAAYTNHTAVAEALLENGADINILDYDGDSALIQSIYSSADDVTQLLLLRGADYTVWDSLGNSVLHGAALYGGCKTLDLLRTAELHSVDPDARNSQGQTVLQLAQARASKPEGFIEKLQDVLAEIRVRNIAKTAIQSIESSQRTHQSTRKLRPIGTTQKIALQHRTQKRYHQGIFSKPKVTFAIIILIVLLSILAWGLLRFSFSCDALGFNRMKHIITQAWIIFSPGDTLEL